MPIEEIHLLHEVEQCLTAQGHLRDVVIQGVDLTGIADRLAGIDMGGAVLLGCTLATGTQDALTAQGAMVFPAMTGLPFDVYRTHLYTYDELFDGFEADNPCSYGRTPDSQIYRHWKEAGRATPSSAKIALAQRLHDYSVHQAIARFMDGFNPDMVVAIMGGHSMARDSAEYRDIVFLSARLTRLGFLMISGGGPGAMEATHVGASMAYHSAEDIEAALVMLSDAPTYKDADWLGRAFDVMTRFGLQNDTVPSLGIPTWLYGHEPPNPFASHIAKFFSNSLREDGLITLAYGGIIFAPGSAGTIQEVFQDFAQNHYATTGKVSPMVFMGREFWTKTRPIYPFIKTFAQGQGYDSLITITDDQTEIVDFIAVNPPRLEVEPLYDFSAVHCE